MTAPTPYADPNDCLGAYAPQVRPPFRLVFKDELRRIKSAFRGSCTEHGAAVESALSEAAYEAASEAHDPVGRG